MCNYHVLIQNNSKTGNLEYFEAVGKETVAVVSVVGINVRNKRHPINVAFLKETAFDEK